MGSLLKSGLKTVLRARSLLSSGRWALPSLFLLFGLAFGAGPDEASGQEYAGGWTFTSLPQADLWFHGMALVDPIGPGPNPLYDPEYGSRVRRAREEAGISSSVLEDRIGYFREAFQRDPAFEVFHFLPLYFPRTGRVEFFSALKLLAAAEEGIPRAPSALTAFGMAAVGGVLTESRQREILGEFVEALEAEWEEFFRGWWRGRAEEAGRIQNSLTDLWRSEYGPALAPYLTEVGMSGGVAALVPAIGVDGRIFGGSPRNQQDNVLAVSAPEDLEHGNEAIFAVLREMAFPMVRRVMDGRGVGAGDRIQEELLSSRAAIRSGAMILERHHPKDLPDYQRFFLSQSGSRIPEGQALEGAFRQAFPLDPAFENALREEIFK